LQGCEPRYGGVELVAFEKVGVGGLADITGKEILKSDVTK